MYIKYKLMFISDVVDIVVS